MERCWACVDGLLGSHGETRLCFKWALSQPRQLRGRHETDSATLGPQEPAAVRSQAEGRGDGHAIALAACRPFARFCHCATACACSCVITTARRRGASSRRWFLRAAARQVRLVCTALSSSPLIALVCVYFIVVLLLEGRHHPAAGLPCVDHTTAPRWPVTDLAIHRYCAYDALTTPSFFLPTPRLPTPTFVSLLFSSPSPFFYTL